ncbi:MAG: ABC transporter ATP-binding protein/permease [Oscillospiraceae bacterium]|jgi:putative ATP-binding cassette transporter|nr:ABC transporter ATP-binding protein/permease [Oscillospiraceae bacterium]
MKKQKFSVVVARIWKMTTPYWLRSDEALGSFGLLIINLAMTFFSNSAMLRYNLWWRDWQNAFTNMNAHLWQQQIYVFLLFGASMLFSSTFNIYISSWISVRWNRWMTARYLKLWMENSNHYKMQLSGNETDNPDQRISEDIALFTTNTWTFAFGFVTNIIQLVTYITVLWELSLSIPLILGGRDWSFPGYFIVLSILWAAITTIVTHIIGKPMTRLTYNQQMYNANYRFALVRFREQSEQIALLRGEDVEHSRLMVTYGDMVVNQFRTMARTLKMGLTAGVLQYVDAMMFTLLLGPAFFFYNAIPGYGTFNLIATAFQNVVTGFKWFNTNYALLAAYVAVIDRLYAFNDNYDKTMEVIRTSELKFKEGDKDEVHIENLDVYLPTGKLQIVAKDVTLKRGEKVLIKGRTGAGKTTLFRVLAQIWPYGKGNITLPKNKRVIVLPQNPYFPIGTLVEAVSYPEPPDTYKREDIKQAFIDVGMPGLVDRLDEIGHWNMMLSGGEQQRVGIARAMLYNPDYLFFDEATASMDEPSEEELYSMLLERMKDTTIISIGHRSSLEKFHKRILYAEKVPAGNYEFQDRTQ